VLTRLAAWPSCYVGHVDITPEGPLPLAGYKNRHGSSTGVHSSLEAGFLLCEAAGEPCLLIGLDTLFASEALRERLADALAPKVAGLAARHIQLVASHTHYAPSLDPTKPRLGEANEAYLDTVVMRLARCIVTAIDDGGITISHCRTTAAECAENVHRRRLTWVRQRRSLRFTKQVATAPNTRVAVDSMVRSSTLVDGEGATRLVLWSWPCHPVSRGQTSLVSADFPGVVRSRLRSQYGDDVVILYLPGLSGDVRPRQIQQSRSLRDVMNMPFARGFAPFDEDSHASWCARVAAAVADATAESDGPVGLDGSLEVDGPLELYVSGTPVDEITTVGANVDTRSLPLADIMVGLEDDTRSLDCTRIMLPPLSLALINAEVCAGYADTLDDVDHASGCVNSVHGYLPTDAQIAVGGYEVEGFAPLFSLSGRYRPGIARRISAFFRKSAADGDTDAGA